MVGFREGNFSQIGFSMEKFHELSWAVKSTYQKVNVLSLKSKNFTTPNSENLSKC